MTKAGLAKAKRRIKEELSAWGSGLEQEFEEIAESYWDSVATDVEEEAVELIGVVDWLELREWYVKEFMRRFTKF